MSLVDDGETPATHQKATGVHLVESKEGQRDWELNASSASSVKGDGSWELEKVLVKFYNLKSVEFTVTGERGHFDSKTRNISIQGQVVTETANGYTIRTDSISYISKDRLLESPGLVDLVSKPKFEGRSMRMKGSGLQGWVDRKELLIQHDVQGVYPIRAGQEFSLLAGSALLKTVDSSASFEGAVKLKVGDKVIEGPTALFLYGDESDILKAVQINGGVRMRELEKSRSATSDSVRFDPESNSYILSGNPRVVQDLDEILGEQITLLDGGRKIKVEKMKARVEQGGGSGE